MVSNPLNEERLTRLKEDTAELLKQFGILYTKNYGVAIYQKIKEEIQPDKSPQWKLSQRPSNCVKRQLFSGECYMRQGEGPSTFSGWTKQFVVETQDYNIDVFPDEKASRTAGKKPTLTIPIAGYRVVSDVSEHYRGELQELADSVGLSAADIVSLTACSRYSWALTHPQRKNYIFQLHQSKSGKCACFGGGAVEPDDVGADKRDDIVKWVDNMRRMTMKANPRGKDVVNIAFDRTCNQIGSRIQSLATWRDNGTEAEMLVDMAMESVLPPLRDDILSDMRGTPVLKLKLWYKSRNTIQKVLLKVIEEAWTRMQKLADGLREKIEPVIRPLVTEVVKVTSNIHDKINAKVSDTLGESLAKYVTPFVKPIIDAFEKPLKEGFERGRCFFEEKMQLSDLPDDTLKRDEMLDSFAQQPENLVGMATAAGSLIGPLENIKSLSAEVFYRLDTDALRVQAEDILIQAMDAAAYTVKVRLAEGQTKDDQLKQQILLDYDHDTTLMRCEFIKTATRQMLINAFKMLVSNVTDPLVDQLNDNIPETMQDFLNIENIINGFIEVLVGGAIDKTVEGAFPTAGN
jgi:hypothetical protein